MVRGGKTSKELSERGYYAYKKSEVGPHDRYVVFISRQPTFPNIQGNRVYMNEILSWLRSVGYKILYLYPCLHFRESLAAMADSVDDLYVVDPGYKAPRPFPTLAKIDHSCGSGFKALEEILEIYPVEVVLGSYAHMGAYLSLVSSSVKKIILTHDALHKLAFLPFKIAENRLCTYEEEKKLLSFADAIIAINETESNLFKGMFGEEKKVITVGMPATPAGEGFTIDEKGTPNLFAAASGNPMNVEGLGDFIENAWPKILASFPKVELKIAGAVCDSLKKYENYDGLTLLGVVEDLSPFMKKASLVLNATKEGTGLKIKSIEALAYGKALATFPSGVDGMVALSESGVLVGQSEEELSQKIIKILKDPIGLSGLEDKSKSYAKKYLSPQYVYSELNSFLKKDEKGLRSFGFLSHLGKQLRNYFSRNS